MNQTTTIRYRVSEGEEASAKILIPDIVKKKLYDNKGLFTVICSFLGNNRTSFFLTDTGNIELPFAEEVLGTIIVNINSYLLNLEFSDGLENVTFQLVDEEDE